MSDGKTLRNDSIISIKNELDVWTVKMTNGYLIPITNDEYPWLMTVCGTLIQIQDDLALNMDCIIMFEPNESGYLIGWIGEPPVQLTQEDGLALIQKLQEIQQHIILSERIDYLINNGVSPTIQMI